MRFLRLLFRFRHWFLWSLVLGFCTCAVAAALVLNAKLPDSLYKNEQWKVSRIAEEAEFIRQAVQVQSAQDRILKDPIKAATNGFKKRRVFHSKSHGCYTGQIEMNSIDARKGQDPKGDTQVGLFVSGAKYPVVVRFSNGAGWTQPDGFLDLRGMAVKLLDDVRDPETGADMNVDLITVNSTNPPGRDQQGLIDVMEFAIGGAEAKLAFKHNHPDMFKYILDTEIPIGSIATARFWSGHAYLMGPDLAMKFNFAPDANNGPAASFLSKLTNPHYLRTDLMKKLKKNTLKWAVNIQLEKTPDKTPIENTFQEWLETDSPSIRVGTLTLDRQDPLNEQTCEDLRFNPGHYYPLHRPLGNMGRGRVFAYEASQLGRLLGVSADPVRHASEFLKR